MTLQALSSNDKAMNAPSARWFVSLATALSAIHCCADDWPRWRGPELNGISKETGWFKPWPAQGPKQLWKANVQTGFSTVSVAKGRVFTTGSSEKKETVSCLDEKTGAVIWKHTYPTAFVPEYYEGGSSGTPTVDGDRVFHLAQMGELFCFDTAMGKVIWEKHIAKETGTRQPTWGLTGAPFVLGDLLILNVGATGTAVEKNTGKVVWTSAGEGGYATPLLLGDDLLIYATKALAVVDPKNGKPRGEFPWKTSYDVNAADPLVIGKDRVVIASGYNHGAALLEIKGGQITKVWEAKSMRNHFNASVFIGGHLFGIDGDAGRKDSGVACVDLATGASKWREPSLGSGGITAADGKLIILSEKGELVIAEPSPSAFQPLARAQVLGGKIWTVPVLANGRIYARNSKGDLVCIDPSGK